MVIFHLYLINSKLNAVDEIQYGWRNFEASIGNQARADRLGRDNERKLAEATENTIIHPH
jgi:hypothetical protein